MFYFQEIIQVVAPRKFALEDRGRNPPKAAERIRPPDHRLPRMQKVPSHPQVTLAQKTGGG